ncbi:HEPN domain-containing protein [Stygiolobus caldivivus]
MLIILCLAKRVEDWLKQAERDLEEARFANSGGYYELMLSSSATCRKSS